MNTVNFGTDPTGVEESQIANRLRLAQLLQQQAMDGAPVYSNKAGVAKMLTAILAGVQQQSAEKDQRSLAERREAGRKSEMDAVFKAMQGEPAYLPADLPQKDDEGNAMPGSVAKAPDRMALARVLAASSNPAMAQAGLQLAMKGPEKPEAFTLKPGERRYVGDRVVAEVPDMPKDTHKKGDTRRIATGGDEITQEWTGTEWKEIGKAPRWQPQQPDRSLVEIQDPSNPMRTILVPRDQAAGKAGAGSVTSARQTREDADSLRKEFTGLPAVKTYNEVKPIVESAKKAPDTPQGDFALIYGVGKVLDPNSVVREGEMNLVIASGSPAQRVSGYLAQLQGKGRLTPAMRKELVGILETRAGEYEKQYQAARSTYDEIVKQRGHDPRQVFTQSPYSTDGDGRKVVRTGTLNGRKVVQYSDGTTDYAP